MGATLTTISNVLKNFYLGPVREQLNSKILAMQILQVETENLEGLKAILPLHTSRSSGVGARAELDNLPNAGNQVFAQAQYDLKYLYGRVNVSGQAIAKSASDAGSFLRAMKAELDYIKDDIAVDFARQVYGDGSGQVAVCGTTTASATVVLASSEPLRKGFLHIGMVVDIGTAANPVSLVDSLNADAGANSTISAYSLTTPSITIGKAITTSASNFVFRSGNVVAGPTVKEMDTGLQTILATSQNSVGGINGASAGNEYWNNQSDTAGSAISLSRLMQLYNVCNAFGAQNDVICVTTPGAVRLLFGTADFAGGSAPLIRFVNTKELKGGFSSLSFDTGGGPVTLASDRHAPYGKVFIIDKNHVKLFSPADWDFLQKDGLTIRQVANKDAYEAILFRYANMGTDRRNSSAVMTISGDTTGA